MASQTSTPHAGLVADALAYCNREGIAPTTFGQRVVKDRNFIGRLLNGGRCWPETEAKVREFMQTPWRDKDAQASGASDEDDALQAQGGRA